jgi:hypothetical protein
MKNILEISDLLSNEISKYEGLHVEGNNIDRYVNDQLGNTSIFISGFVYSLLKKEDSRWGIEKWIDDALIEKFNSSIQKIEMSGIIIWGRQNTSRQWVSPFFFSKIKIGESFSCYFSDVNKKEVVYEDFCRDRSLWRGKHIRWEYKFDDKDLK